MYPPGDGNLEGPAPEWARGRRNRWQVRVQGSFAHPAPTTEAKRPPNRRARAKTRRDSSCRRQDHSTNTERQRAARGAVSCPLPAPNEDTQPLGGSPVKNAGVRGRRDRALKMPVSRPRRSQGELPRRGKRRWPGPFGSFCAAAKGTRPQAKSPYPFCSRSERADEDIGPYEGKRQQVVRGGRTLCAPTKKR